VDQTSTEPIATSPAPAPAPSPQETFTPRVIAAGLTDRGKEREANEDHFVVAQMKRAMVIHATSLPQPPAILAEVVRGHLFVVADGMGGHNAGEQASALAVMTIEDFLLNTLRWFFSLQGDDLLTEFQNALKAADDRIFAEARRRPETRGMGTTLTFAYATGGPSRRLLRRLPPPLRPLRPVPRRPSSNRSPLPWWSSRATTSGALPSTSWRRPGAARSPLPRWRPTGVS
jgi:hypothetical protein